MMGYKVQTKLNDRWVDDSIALTRVDAERRMAELLGNKSFADVRIMREKVS